MTVGKATFSSRRKSRLVFRSCQQPRELDRGTQDAERATVYCCPASAVLLRGGSRPVYASQPHTLLGEKVRRTAAEAPIWHCGDHVCAILSRFHDGQCPCNPLQNGEQPSQEHGGLLSRPCLHTAEGTRCVCRGRLGFHLHGYRVMHLGEAEGSPSGSHRGTLWSRQQLGRTILYRNNATTRMCRKTRAKCGSRQPEGFCSAFPGCRMCSVSLGKDGEESTHIQDRWPRSVPKTLQSF